IGNHPTREASDFVHLFVEGDAFLQILELHRAADFSEDGVSVRIPLGEQLTKLDRFTLLHPQTRAINYLVALLLAAALVHNGEGTGAIHGHQGSVLTLDSVEV